MIRYHGKMPIFVNLSHIFVLSARLIHAVTIPSEEAKEKV